MLRMVGLWTPENAYWKTAYRYYSNFCAIVWVLFFLCTQAYFFINVSSVADVADALYFFLNELMLLPKIYYYRKNATLMKKVVAKLESENFLPKNMDEEKYCKELQKCFKESIFVQLITTCFICCMTELQMAVEIKKSIFLFLTNSLPYFFVLAYQIYLLCKAGNELTYASKSLMYDAFRSNFMTFDKRTSNVLLLFMERVKRDIKIDAQLIFTITLSIQNFLSIMRASYSYFAVLQSLG
uniref:CSON005363 protein n=1 Tax=Culicoides sonorensis TaxID=179676 RepID=A0A336MUF1_CULSO